MDTDELCDLASHRIYAARQKLQAVEAQFGATSKRALHTHFEFVLTIQRFGRYADAEIEYESLIPFLDKSLGEGNPVSSLYFVYFFLCLFIPY